MLRSDYYEPPPDYSDSGSDSDELQCKSLGMFNLRDSNNRGQRVSSVANRRNEERECEETEQSHDVGEIVVPSARLQAFIPRSNWTLCQKKRITLQNSQRMPSALLNALKPRNGDSTVNGCKPSAPSKGSAVIKLTNNAPRVTVQGRALPPPPPPPPMPTPTIAAKASLFKPSAAPSFTPSPPAMPKPKPRRTMSTKSAVNPFNQDTMKPLINEFRFYQKTHKNILGQKSELQKVIEKRQQREKQKQLEEERTKVTKTGLEQLLELRALKLNGNNSSSASSPSAVSINGGINGLRQDKNSSESAVSGQAGVTSGGRRVIGLQRATSVSFPASPGSLSASPHSSYPSSSPGSTSASSSGSSSNLSSGGGTNSSHVQLILKTIESNKQKTHHTPHHSSQDAAGKFCSRIDFPSAPASPWSAKTNFVR